MLRCAGRTGSGTLLQTIHLNPDERQEVSRVTEVIEGLLAEGKGVTVTVAEDGEYLSPQQAADRLGFSRQHVVRLINARELPAEKLANSSYWRIPVASVVAFEERSERGRLRADEFSRALDELGAPLE
jgi:excisionase family DNA binding protein